MAIANQVKKIDSLFQRQLSIPRVGRCLLHEIAERF